MLVVSGRNLKMFEELIRDFNDDVTVEYKKEHKLEQFLLP